MTELFNPHSANWLLTKFETYKILRNRESAYWSEKYQMHIITRYNDVYFALKNPEIFSSAKGNLIVEMSHRFGSTLGASDDPRHSFYKNIVKNAYSKTRILELTNKVEKRLNKEFDLQANQAVIQISKLIETISAYVSSEILGLPVDNSVVENLIIDIQQKSSRAVYKNCDDSSYDQFVDMIKNLIENNVDPTSDGIYKDFLENNPKRYPIYSLFTGPTLSGASSLTGALEFLTLDLFKENQIDAILKDRNLIDNAVNESLRFHASTGRFSRTVTQEILLHGVTLTPGTRIAICLESANRDPDKFVDPDTFDLHRDTSGHLGFGYGPHACIALVISKAIMSVYLKVLLEKVGKYKITTLPNEYNYVLTQSGNDDMINNLALERCS